MKAADYLRSGDLDQALKRLEEEIRASPAKADLRIFLFQTLCVMGQWERALTQLSVAAEMDEDAKLMAQMYRPAIGCEAVREAVFKGEKSPLFLGEPPEWLVWVSQVLPLLAKGERSAAAELRDRAFEAAPAIPGTLNGEAFEWIADADPRLGPVFELILDGKYWWVPFSNIREIHMEAPTDLRDVVWTSAHLIWANGGEGFGLVPSRYPGSETATDAGIRMGRRTDWSDAGEGFHVGVGQRIMATDQAECPLLEVRHIVLHLADDKGAGTHA